MISNGAPEIFQWTAPVLQETTPIMISFLDHMMHAECNISAASIFNGHSSIGSVGISLCFSSLSGRTGTRATIA